MGVEHNRLRSVLERRYDLNSGFALRLQFLKLKSRKGIESDWVRNWDKLYMALHGRLPLRNFHAELKQVFSFPQQFLKTKTLNVSSELPCATIVTYQCYVAIQVIRYHRVWLDKMMDWRARSGFPSGCGTLTEMGTFSQTTWSLTANIWVDTCF